MSRTGPRIEKEPPATTLPWQKESDDPNFVWCASASFIKKALQKQGPYGHALGSAQNTLKWHKSESDKIRKYIKKAANKFVEEFLDSDSDCVPYHPVIKKFKLADDADMSKV